MSELDSIIAQRRIGSEEELLEYQKKFQEGQIQSSTKLIRVVRNKPTDGNANINSSIASVAPIEIAASASTSENADATSDPFVSDASIEPSADSIFHTKKGIAERQAVAPPRTSFGSGSVAAVRTGFPAAFKANLRQTQSVAPPTAATHSVSASNADVAVAPVKKKSLFAQQRDRMLAQQQQATNATANASSTSSPSGSTTAPSIEREVVRMSTAPQQLVPSFRQTNGASTSSSPPPELLAAAAASAAKSHASVTTIARPPPATVDALPELRGVHEENLDKLNEMSASEIEEAQRELEAQLPAALVAMLRAKRGGGTGSSNNAIASIPSAFAPPQPSVNMSYPTPQQLNEYLLDGTGDGNEDDSASDHEDDGIDELGERVAGAAQRQRLDQALDAFSRRLESEQELSSQKEKLEWSQPIQPTTHIEYPETVQGYNNDGNIWNSWRVDLEGRFIPQGATSPQPLKSTSSSTTLINYDDPSNALYHHGDEADRPGYTMRELLHLVRSTVMSQRTLALQVLAKVLARIKQNEYSYPATVKPTPRALQPAIEALGNTDIPPLPIPPFAHLLLSHLLYLNLITLLRLALDDNRNPGGILAALLCFEALLHSPLEQNEPLQHAQSGFKGHERISQFQQLTGYAQEMNRDPVDGQTKKPKKTIADDVEDDEGVRAEEKTGDPEGLSDNARDEDRCARDLIVGLSHMQFLERIRYILEVYTLPAVIYRAKPPQKQQQQQNQSKGKGVSTDTPASDALAGLVLLSPLLNVLLSFALHSPQASSRLFDTGRLKETLGKVTQSLAEIVACESDQIATTTTAQRGVPGSLPLASLASSLHTALILLGVLSQVHRDMCHYFLTARAGGSGSVFAALKRFIVLPNGLPTGDLTTVPISNERDSSDAEMALLLPLSIQSLHLWRICLSYGLDIESFMDHYPVLLAVLTRTPLYIKRVTGTPVTSVPTSEQGKLAQHAQVSELWLRQLRGVCSVVEGLTLLFAPASGTAASLASQQQAKGGIMSAPPVALSFEFSHVVHTVEAALGALASIWFALPSTVSTTAGVSLRSTLHETLAGFLHLFAAYYSVLPSQPQCEWALLRHQVEKHTHMCFAKWSDSPLLSQAKALVAELNERGIESVQQLAGVEAIIPLNFSNLPQSVPSSMNSPIQQSLNVLFGLLRWQESLLTHIPRAPPTGSKLVPQDGDLTSAEASALGASLQRVLLSSRELRSFLLTHFYSSTSPASRLAACAKDGFNRVSSRANMLTGLESELVVTLLIMNRMEVSPGEDAASLGTFYARVISIVPALLRNGKQFLVSKLFADVLFNASVLSKLAPGATCTTCQLSAPSKFSFAQAKLLHDLYASFAYYPEELLVSTLLHTGSLLTPTLCSPICGPSNIIAHTDITTGTRLAVPLKGGVNHEYDEHASGAWLISMIKHAKFLQVQTSKKLGSAIADHSSKLSTILNVWRYLLTVDQSLGLFTPFPEASFLADNIGAHPMSTLFLRSVMELYLQGSDIFLADEFVALAQHFLHRLLMDHKVVEAARTRSQRFIGVPNHAQSTLLFGGATSSLLHAPGDATLRNSADKVLKLISPADDGVPSNIIGTGTLAQLIPFHDFQCSQFPTSIWGKSFYPFFKDFIELFISDSMGDANFARMVLLLLREEYPLDYRLVIWRECRELMQSLSAAGQLPLDKEGFLFPLERSADAQGLLVELLAGAPAALTAERNSDLYQIALHHVSAYLFGWKHVSGIEGMSATERVRIIQEQLPMSKSPQLVKDLMQYRHKDHSLNKCVPVSSAVAVSLLNGAAASSTAVSDQVLALTPAQLAVIESNRADSRKRNGPPSLTPGTTLGLLCPCCHKSNALGVAHCTGCSFALCDADQAALIERNPFLDIVHRNADALAVNTVIYRDDESVLVIDRYGTSIYDACHIDCLSTEIMIDITELRSRHIPLLERMYIRAREFVARGALEAGWLNEKEVSNNEFVDEFITAGFNYPVSVKQLHLHVILPPFKHEKIFTYPRWHSYQKVIRDLNTYGRVKLYTEEPNEKEGAEVLKRALDTNERAKKLLEERKIKTTSTAATHSQ
jgi:hypothetical protein